MTTEITSNTESPQKHELIMSLKNVGLSYRRKRGVFGDEFWALKDVSFDLYQGDTLGIIGRNGVGKSTLLRLMAGIMQPSRGQLINFGYQASLLSLQLGFIYYLSGRENAILSGMFLGLRKCSWDCASGKFWSAWMPSLNLLNWATLLINRLALIRQACWRASVFLWRFKSIPMSC